MIRSGLRYYRLPWDAVIERVLHAPFVQLERRDMETEVADGL
jgi:hypothetical protein